MNTLNNLAEQVRQDNYIGCFVGEKSFLFDADDVLSILHLPRTDCYRILKQDHEVVRWVLKSNDETIPVADLGIILFNKPLDPTNACIIISMAQGRKVGFLLNPPIDKRTISREETRGGLPLSVRGLSPSPLCDFWSNDGDTVFILNPSCLIHLDEV